MEIVSNNNSAVVNVFEKLASPKYCLDFLVAPLGRSKKKRTFIENQSGRYPDLSTWEQTPEKLQELRSQTTKLAQELSSCFEKQERLACARQEISALELEMKYFNQFCEEYELIEPIKSPRRGICSSTVLQILQECERFLEQRNAVSFWHKAKSTILFGLFEWTYYENDISVVVTYLLKLFYNTKHQELVEEIGHLHHILNAADASEKMSQLTQLSVFDLLYQQYTAQRIAFLSKHRKVSQFDSENLMYASLVDLLSKHPDIPLNIVCHQSVRLLIRNFDKLTDVERQYASHPSTHVDFLIYNRVTKTPILAVEVDGFHYHKSGTAQAQRDQLKDSIFSKYQIPLLRFPTNGSNEIQRIERFLFGSAN